MIRLWSSFKYYVVILSGVRSLRDRTQSKDHYRRANDLTEVGSFDSSLRSSLKMTTRCLRPSAEERRANSVPYNSLRPSIAFCIVTSSAYSISLPTGTPVAMRVTFTAADLNNRER